MNSNVTVVADATTNAVISISANNPQYGFVRFQQTRTMIDESGFLRRRTVSSLIHAPILMLQEMKYYSGQIIPGNIVVKESMIPFNKKTPERDLKVAGATGIVCRVNGEPIYRKTTYSQNPNSVDEIIAHDNIEELRNAYAAKNNTSSKAMSPNTDFDLK